MTKNEFEQILDLIADQLTEEAKLTPFTSASTFENSVRNSAREHTKDQSIEIDFAPHPQAFPDIAIGDFGIEVKFTNSNSWRSVANSILESNRIDSVKFVYIMFGKMGGDPCVKWGEYEESVIHVRTSHVPRFEVEIGAKTSLFSQMGISYETFRSSDMHEKMEYIRRYARGRLKSGERLWWLEDPYSEDEHTLPIQARLYTKLSTQEKTALRAESILLCPKIVSSGRSRDKYDEVVLYLLTYHGVLAHQARDMFSAGSVANPNNKKGGGIYIERAIKLLENEIRDAASRMDDKLFIEYWGVSVPKQNRIKEWLRRADKYATNWTPSKSLFLEDQL